MGNTILTERKARAGGRGGVRGCIGCIIRGYIIRGCVMKVYVTVENLCIRACVIRGQYLYTDKESCHAVFGIDVIAYGSHALLLTRNCFLGAWRLRRE